jgi:hypothetical protein
MIPTKEQWDKHPSFRQELQELVSHPTFQTALAMTKDKGMRKSLATVGNADLIQYFALMGAHRDGYTSALDDLVALTRSKDSRPLERGPWDSADKPKVDDDRTSAP